MQNAYYETSDILDIVSAVAYAMQQHLQNAESNMLEDANIVNTALLQFTENANNDNLLALYNALTSTYDCTGEFRSCATNVVSDYYVTV